MNPVEALIITLSREQLGEIISEAVEAGVQRVMARQAAATPAGEEDDLLDAEQAARLLRLKIRSVYNKTSQRELPFMKRGRKIYFSRRELLDWMTAGRTQTRAETLVRAQAMLQARRPKSAH
jgi:excisionase family DNA binding protein